MEKRANYLRDGFVIGSPKVHMNLCTRLVLHRINEII